MIFPEKYKSASSRFISSYAVQIEEQYPELILALSEKPFSAVDTGVHAKLLADWNRKGLLIDPHTANKRHRFSLTEFVWIKLIEKMREYNFSLEFIRSFRNEMVKPTGLSVNDFINDPDLINIIKSAYGDKHKGALDAMLSDKKFMEQMVRNFPFDTKTLTDLHGLILFCLLVKQPLSFMLNKDGIGTIFCPLLLEAPEIDKQEFYDIISRSHVTLSLTEVLADVLAIAPIDKLSGELNILTQEEAKILEALRQKKLTSVLVRFDKQNKMDLMEVKSELKVDKRSRLLEMILLKGYQDITVKTAKGNIVFCENTRKIKLK